MPQRKRTGCTAQWGRPLLLSFAIWLTPASAEAHTALQSVGSFWSGVAHVLTSLDQLGFLLGLAIWTSFQDRRMDTRVIGAAFAAALSGVWFGARFGEMARLDLSAFAAALMTVVGLAGAMRLRVRAEPLLGLALAGGIVGGAAGADAAVGESSLQVRFGNTAPGAPLPDLQQLFGAPVPGQEGPSFISFYARADGTLRGNFGVPDGTPGRAEVIETGNGATGDGFPAERINLNAVGH